MTGRDQRTDRPIEGLEYAPLFPKLREARMSKVEDGGPAFPQHVAISPSGDVYGSSYYGEGMPLRDWFAGRALSVLLAFPEPDPTGTNVDFEIGPHIDAVAKHYAKVSYIYADAMLAARTAREASDAT